MSTRRQITAAWAGLCLAGIAATSALNAEPYTDKPVSPVNEPTPTGTYAIDCQEIADDIEQARAEAKREQQEALKPSATPAYQSTVTDWAAPEECADELEDRGLKTR
ncbi:hypothetical protein ACFRQM_11215 [Streptomyces sp. NPDC056831]|uniref:hypothetical protein n=1 Tax=Streptomyces sp. NPDC056831 TaxID=3345954 RepID=UPI003687EED6